MRSKFYRSSIEVLSKFYRNSMEILSKFYRNSIEILSKFYWNSIEILSNFHWNSIEILSTFYRNSIEILSKFYRNSIEILSTFYRNSIETLWCLTLLCRALPCHAMPFRRLWSVGGRWKMLAAKLLDPHPAQRLFFSMFLDTHPCPSRCRTLLFPNPVPTAKSLNQPSQKKPLISRGDRLCSPVHYPRIDHEWAHKCVARGKR